MGQSLSTKLVYGLKVFDADEESWPYPMDRDTYRTVWPAWVELDNEDEDDPQPDDFETQCESRLRSLFTGPNVSELGFHRAGCTNYLDIYLGFRLFKGRSASEFDIQSLTDEWHTARSYKGWQETIAQATEALNFQVSDDLAPPRLWLLASYW